jgi:hypothetical protein
MHSADPPPARFTAADRSCAAPSTMTATGPDASAALTCPSWRASSAAASAFSSPPLVDGRLRRLQQCIGVQRQGLDDLVNHQPARRG